MSYQALAWVDKIAPLHLTSSEELLVMLRIADGAGGTDGMASGHLNVAELAGKCLMGTWRLLAHLHELERRGLLTAADPFYPAPAGEHVAYVMGGVR